MPAQFIIHDYVPVQCKPIFVRSGRFYPSILRVYFAENAPNVVFTDCQSPRAYAKMDSHCVERERCARVAEESRFLSFMGMRVHFSVARPEGEIRNRGCCCCARRWITTFHWRKLLPELEQLGCLTVMVDLPGFGLSDCSADRFRRIR